jgi:uncharacterized membrane protein (DUF4010 family)
VNPELLILRSMGLALLIGALIGLEREYHHRLKGEKGFAGLRTFMFYALLGNIATWLSVEANAVILPGAFLGLILLLAVNYFRPGASDERDRGMTTEVAALLTFLLGCMVAVGEQAVAVALGVVVAALLSAKPTLVRWVQGLTTEDIYTTLKFAVITFVVLPILPDREYGPFQSFNPYEIWLMVVLISGVSFLGYIALKLLGPKRGTALSGILGGLASSTAVAISFSRQSRETPELSRSCALAIVLASTVMVVRIGVLVSAVYSGLFYTLWLAVLLLLAAGVIASLWLWRGARRDPAMGGGLEIRNPFRLSSVLGFGAAYALVLFLVKAGRTLLPDGSTEIIALVSGLTQVDAITLSVAKLAGEGMALRLAAAAVLIAALSNTVTKVMIGVSLGDVKLRRPLLLGLGLILVCGLLVLPLYYV